MFNNTYYRFDCSLTREHTGSCPSTTNCRCYDCGRETRRMELVSRTIELSCNDNVIS